MKASQRESSPLALVPGWPELSDAGRKKPELDPSRISLRK